jgi:hypothetical protein
VIETKAIEWMLREHARGFQKAGLNLYEPKGIFEIL